MKAAFRLAAGLGALLTSAAPAHAYDLALWSNVWTTLEQAVDAGRNGVRFGADPETPGHFCLIAKGADPIARLTDSFGRAPEFRTEAIETALTALRADDDFAVLLEGDAVVAIARRSEWAVGPVFLGGASCAPLSTGRIMIHRRPKAFLASEESIYLIVTP